MTKILIETVGEHMLLDPQGGQVVESHRPTVVTNSNFIQNQVVLGRATSLGKLTDEATDEAFVEAIDGSKNMDVAVEAFLSEFGETSMSKKGKDVEGPKPLTAAEKKAEAAAEKKAEAEAEKLEAKRLVDVEASKQAELEEKLANPDTGVVKAEAGE